MPGHGPGLDFTSEAVAHDHVVALAVHFDESRNIAKVITVVRIPHDDERAAGASDARAQCGAVPALRNANYPCTVLFRNLNRAVGRAIVRDNYFTAEPGGLKRFPGFVHAMRH